MTATEKILLRIGGRGGGTIDNLAKELDMRKSTVQAMIEFMVHAGYLKEFSCGDGCAGCFMYKKCNISASEGVKMRMYVLTEKGMECIKDPKMEIE